MTDFSHLNSVVRNVSNFGVLVSHCEMSKNNYWKVKGTKILPKWTGMIGWYLWLVSEFSFFAAFGNENCASFKKQSKTADVNAFGADTVFGIFSVANACIDLNSQRLRKCCERRRNNTRPLSESLLHKPRENGPAFGLTGCVLYLFYNFPDHSDANCTSLTTQSKKVNALPV